MKNQRSKIKNKKESEIIRTDTFSFGRKFSRIHTTTLRQATLITASLVIGLAFAGFSYSAFAQNERCIDDGNCYCNGTCFNQCPGNKICQADSACDTQCGVAAPFCPNALPNTGTPFPQGFICTVGVCTDECYTDNGSCEAECGAGNCLQCPQGLSCDPLIGSCEPSGVTCTATACSACTNAGECSIAGCVWFGGTGPCIAQGTTQIYQCQGGAQPFGQCYSDLNNCDQFCVQAGQGACILCANQFCVDGSDCNASGAGTTAYQCQGGTSGGSGTGGLGSSCTTGSDCIPNVGLICGQSAGSACVCTNPGTGITQCGGGGGQAFGQCYADLNSCYNACVATGQGACISCSSCTSGSACTVSTGGTSTVTVNPATQYPTQPYNPDPLVKNLGKGAINLCGVLCPKNFGDFLSLLQTVFNVLLYFAIPIAVIVFGIGGVTLLSSAGNEEKTRKGKAILFWGVVGLAIVLLAKGILTAILAFL